MTDLVLEESPLRVIMGPTAAGKSGLAMQLAETLGLAIVSADSRQVYAGFDIGTAKPMPTDRARVPHYGIDVLDPTVRYSAHAWAEDARRWMREALVSGTPPVIVGGTGFYVRALVSPFDATPELDVDRRRALAGWLDGLDAAELERWCRTLDPARAALGPVQRRRAIETALLSGRRLSDEHAESAPQTPPRLPVHYLVVDPGPVLADRIRLRVEEMVAHGWFAEVEQLMRTIPPDAPAWNASGYGTIRAGVAGMLTRDEVVERVTIETRQYAKRQRTWCRNQLGDGVVTTIDPLAPDAADRALAWWNAARPEPA